MELINERYRDYKKAANYVFNVDVDNRTREQNYSFARFALFNAMSQHGYNSNDIHKLTSYTRRSIIYGIEQAAILMKNNEHFAKKQKRVLDLDFSNDYALELFEYHMKKAEHYKNMLNNISDNFDNE